PSSAEIIDTNVSIGRWPFEDLALDSPAKMVKRLRAHGVTQAWTGHFWAAVTADPSACNKVLAAECNQRGRGILVPFGTVNLRQANWEAELERCTRDLRMPGIRLYPNYHGYKLSEPVFAEFLARAASQNIVVQIATML